MTAGIDRESLSVNSSVRSVKKSVNKCQDSDTFMGFYGVTIANYDTVETRESIASQTA